MISVIIVSYNTRDILRDCLHSVFAQNGVETEVIVIDNASDDGSVEMVKKDFPQVKVISNQNNPGFSAANNQGIQIAKGEYILLLNPDTIVGTNVFTGLVNFTKENPNTIAGPRLVNVDGSLQISAWKFPSVFNSLAELSYVHHAFGVSGYHAEMFSKQFTCDFISGAAIFFHRSLLDKITGLDENLFWMEDVDLCYRASQAGYTCVYLPHLSVVHLGGQSSARNMKKVISNQLLSRLKFCKKHGSMISFWILNLIIFFHILTRMLAFGIVRVFKNTPKASAYVYAFKRFGRYVFLRDTSIA